ncbi:MAG: type II toxin-antitoxin system MqsA family antitoxin [Ruminiclostridium sp.]
MTCFYCKGDMGKSTTTHFAELKNCIVIIKNVPCYKCSQCGETAYTADVAERLEEIISTLEKNMTEIAVVNYSAA